MKEKITLTVEKELKEKARQLAEETGWSISRIMELLFNNTTPSEIKKLHEKELKKKSK